jgi:hypothetical protein
VTAISFSVLKRQPMAVGRGSCDINSYASGINSFLSWLHSNGYIEERLRVPLQPTQKRVLPTYTTEDAARVLKDLLQKIFWPHSIVVTI